MLGAVHHPFGLPFPHLPGGVGAYAPGTGVAVVSAVLFALGSVLQHEAATRCSTGTGLDVRAMLRQRTWVLGQAATSTGTVLQVVALAMAPVSIVQPIVAGGLVVALGFRSLRERSLPDRGELVGAGCTAAGLAVFLVAARPAPGQLRHVPSLVGVVVVAVVALLLVALAARTRRGAVGALTCGAAGGIAAGAAAVLISAALHDFQAHGAGNALASAPLWAALAAAVAAQVGAQQAYGRGALAWSLPALTVLDPLAAVPAARYLLGEHLARGHAVVWAPAALVAVAGIVLLVRTGEGHGG